MTYEQIQEDVTSTQSCYTFDYNGKPCGIDPVDGTFNLWYVEFDYNFPNMKDLFEERVFDGKNLKEIIGSIKNYGEG